jgi:uncharacterized membrane protein YqjE
MSVRFAVFTILSIAACFWTLNMARSPKEWRVHWLNFLTVLDIETPRETRKSQERILGGMSYLLFVVFLSAAISCAYWTFDQVRESSRLKTAPERDLEFMKRQIEEVNKMPRRR